MFCQKFLISPVVFNFRKANKLETHTEYKTVKTFPLDKGNQVTRTLKLIALIVCCEYWDLGITKTKVTALPQHNKLKSDLNSSSKNTGTIAIVRYSAAAFKSF